MEEKIDSLGILMKGMDEYLNHAESGLMLVKMNETFSMDGASNLESIRIAIYNMRRTLAIMGILQTKDAHYTGTEKYCNLADFLQKVIMEVKRVSNNSIEKFDFTDESFEPYLVFDLEKMQILVYNIVRYLILGSPEKKSKIKLTLFENEKNFIMEFRGTNPVSEGLTDIDSFMFSATDKITDVMGFIYNFRALKNTTKCTVKIPKLKQKYIPSNEEVGAAYVDNKLAEIFFADL